MTQFPAKTHIFIHFQVGDDLSRDFAAPLRSGWTIGWFVTVQAENDTSFRVRANLNRIVFSDFSVCSWRPRNVLKP